MSGLYGLTGSGLNSARVSISLPLIQPLLSAVATAAAAGPNRAKLRCSAQARPATNVPPFPFLLSQLKTEEPELVSTTAKRRCNRRQARCRCRSRLWFARSLAGSWVSGVRVSGMVKR